MSSNASHRALGIDLGGTNVRWVICDHSGVIKDSGHQSLPENIEARRAIPAALTHAYRNDVDAVGLAIAGTVQRGRLKWSANLGLADIDFQSLLSQPTGLRAWVLNDARAAGFAESQIGAGRASNIVLTITIGTGIGGAIVANGQLLEDAGEIGHMIMNAHGERCSCGNHGCWELEVGGKALARDARDFGVDLKHLLRRAEEGDEEVIDFLRARADMFGRGVGNLCAILAPDLVVLSGGITARGGILSDMYLQAIATEGNWATSTPIVFSELGDYAGAQGAALWAWQQSALHI